MSYHSGTIHAVRFSPSGLYLASGADDKIVCVYTLDANAPSHGATFGSLHMRNLEDDRATLMEIPQERTNLLLPKHGVASGV